MRPIAVGMIVSASGKAQSLNAGMLQAGPWMHTVEAALTGLLAAAGLGLALGVGKEA